MTIVALQEKIIQLNQSQAFSSASILVGFLFVFLCIVYAVWHLLFGRFLLQGSFLLSDCQSNGANLPIVGTGSLMKTCEILADTFYGLKEYRRAMVEQYSSIRRYLLSFLISVHSLDLL